jgi:hypothetical protein
MYSSPQSTGNIPSGKVCVGPGIDARGEHQVVSDSHRHVAWIQAMDLHPWPMLSSPSWPFPRYFKRMPGKQSSPVAIQPPATPGHQMHIRAAPARSGLATLEGTSELPILRCMPSPLALNLDLSPGFLMSGIDSPPHLLLVGDRAHRHGLGRPRQQGTWRTRMKGRGRRRLQL